MGNGNYRIELEILKGDWLGFSDLFGSLADAESKIAELRKLDSEYAESRFRVMSLKNDFWTFEALLDSP
jgi:hypothetical protein